MNLKTSQAPVSVRLHMALVAALMLSACGSPDRPEWLVQDVNCARGASPVAEVAMDWEWTTWPVLELSLTHEVTGWVRFGTQDDPIQVTPALPWVDGEVVPLRGGRAEREYDYMIVTTDGATEWCDFGRFETGSFVADFPEIYTEVYDSDRVPPAFVTVPIYGEEDGELFTVILDTGGQPVWVSEDSDTSAVVRLHEDRVWTMRSAIDEHSEATMVGQAFDLTNNQEFSVTGSRWSFDIHNPSPAGFDEDTLWTALAWGSQEFEYEGETRKMIGDRIIEFDPVTEVTEVWSAFDSFTPDLSREWPTDSGFYPDATGEDWSHVNSLSFHQEEDAYFVTSDGLEAVIRVDRATGEADWVLGDSTGDFEVIGDQRLVHDPHSAQWLGEDRLLLFNRRTESSDTRCATVDEIALDFDAGTAELVGSYGGEECLTVAFLGEVYEDDDGLRWITYGSAGRFEVLDTDGTLISQAQLDLGAGFGFHSVYESLYYEVLVHPPAPPEDESGAL